MTQDLTSHIPTPSRLILFDCDGTLTDSHAAIVTAMQQAFAMAGITEPDNDTVSAIIGLSLEQAVLKLLSEEQRSDSRLCQQIMENYRLSYREAEQHVHLFPGAAEVLHALQLRGYWLGVVTGKSRPGLIRVLERFELNEYFLVWRTADCTHSKPHPAMVEECMQELGISTEQTCVIGDALFDMEMAANAGVKAIGVSFGVAHPDTLVQAGASAIVHSLEELLAHFPPLHPSSPSPMT